MALKRNKKESFNETYRTVVNDPQGESHLKLYHKLELGNSLVSHVSDLVDHILGIAKRLFPVDGVAGSSGRMECGQCDFGREGW
jgi:hypothetical protein